MWRRKGHAARTMPRADEHLPDRAVPATPRPLAPYSPDASASRPRIACCTPADLAWRSSSPSISPTPPWRIRKGVAPLRTGCFPVTTLGLSLTGRRSTAPDVRQQNRADRWYQDGPVPHGAPRARYMPDRRDRAGDQRVLPDDHDHDARAAPDRRFGQLVLEPRAYVAACQAADDQQDPGGPVRWARVVVR